MSVVDPITLSHPALPGIARHALEIRHNISDIKKEMQGDTLAEPIPLLPCHHAFWERETSFGAVTVTSGLQGDALVGACDIVIKAVKQRGTVGARPILFTFRGSVPDCVPRGKALCTATVTDSARPFRGTYKVSFDGNWGLVGLVGTCSYTNKTEGVWCSGNFIENTMTGKGSFTIGETHTYHGMLLNCQPHGLGSMRWKSSASTDIAKYHGNFLHGKPDGRGKFVHVKDDYEFYGTWKGGDVSGPGIFIGVAAHNKLHIYAMFHQSGCVDFTTPEQQYIYCEKTRLWHVLRIPNHLRDKPVFKLTVDDVDYGAQMFENFEPGDIDALAMPDRVRDDVYCRRECWVRYSSSSDRVRLAGDFLPSQDTGQGTAYLPNAQLRGFFRNGRTCGHAVMTTDDFIIEGAYENGVLAGEADFRPRKTGAWSYKGCLQQKFDSGTGVEDIMFHGFGTLTYTLTGGLSSTGTRLKSAKLFGNWKQGTLHFAYWQVSDERGDVDNATFFAGACVSENIQRQFQDDDPKVQDYHKAQKVPVFADGFGVCEFHGSIFQGVFDRGTPHWGVLMMRVQWDPVDFRKWPRASAGSTLSRSYSSFAVVYDHRSLNSSTMGFQILKSTPSEWAHIRQVSVTVMKQSEPYTRQQEDVHAIWKCILDMVMTCKRTATSKKLKVMHSEFAFVLASRSQATGDIAKLPLWKDLVYFLHPVIPSPSLSVPGSSAGPHSRQKRRLQSSTFQMVVKKLKSIHTTLSNAHNRGSSAAGGAASGHVTAGGKTATATGAVSGHAMTGGGKAAAGGSASGHAMTGGGKAAAGGSASGHAMAGGGKAAAGGSASGHVTAGGKTATATGAASGHAMTGGGKAAAGGSTSGHVTAGGKAAAGGQAASAGGASGLQRALPRTKFFIRPPSRLNRALAGAGSSSTPVAPPVGPSDQPLSLEAAAFFPAQDSTTKMLSAEASQVLSRIQGKNQAVKWLWNKTESRNYVKVPGDLLAAQLEQKYSEMKLGSSSTFHICHDGLEYRVSLTTLSAYCQDAPEDYKNINFRRDEGLVATSVHAQNLNMFWGPQEGTPVLFRNANLNNPLEMSQIEAAARRQSPWNPDCFRNKITIEEVAMIQNPYLLQGYLLKTQQIEQVRGGWSNIHMMWHGTGRASPYDIMKRCFGGLDPSYSRDSALFYGPGVYFSFELPYITWADHSYAYRSQDLAGQVPSRFGDYYHVMLCSVTLGDALDKTNVMAYDKWKLSSVKPFPGKEICSGPVKSALTADFDASPKKDMYKIKPNLFPSPASSTQKHRWSQQHFVRIDARDLKNRIAADEFDRRCHNGSLYMIPADPAPGSEHVRIHHGISFADMANNVLGSTYDSIVSGPHRTLQGGVQGSADQHGNAGLTATVFSKDQVYCYAIVALKMVNGALSPVGAVPGV